MPARLGPLMLDLRGTSLLPEERDMLLHPLTGGVILFTRNYADPEQIKRLVSEIHALREPRLLVAVDHEGGAVQRFRTGFTTLPPCGAYGKLYSHDKRQGLHAAQNGGWLMAAELRAVGVDFSFAPVLDLGMGVSRVINDRAFHRQPAAVIALATAFMRGMQEAGMAAVGKHFPGHGSVVADSHHEIPVDERSYEAIETHDLTTFTGLIQAGIPALMPAHVIYNQIDPQPAGFSRFWLQDVARSQLEFKGALFSDDLSMAGASVAGDTHERARQALAAGCDMGLVCNDPAAAATVLDRLGAYDDPVAHVRLLRMHGHKSYNLETLHKSTRWQNASREIQRLSSEPELPLDDDQLA